MLVKCVKYIDLSGNDDEISHAIRKDNLYPVLAISSTGSSQQLHYYIQGTEHGDFSPFWANAKQFEVVDDQVYSGWQVDVDIDYSIKSFHMTPKIWLANEPWFTDALIDEERAAVDLFHSERDKMLDEWGYNGTYFEE